MIFKFCPCGIPLMSRSDGGKRLSLRELQAATHNFSPTYVLGEGVFGRVYRGRLQDGSCVAIKRVRAHALDGLKQFDAKVEVAFSGLAWHPNLLPLLGHCAEGKSVYLCIPSWPTTAWHLTSGEARGHLIGQSGSK